jgi:hypothetical protein
MRLLPPSLLLTLVTMTGCHVSCGTEAALLAQTAEPRFEGARKALLDNPNLREGLNVYQGKVTYKAVADDLGYDFRRTHPGAFRLRSAWTGRPLRAK